MNDRIEVDINRELLTREINPNDPCGCFIHQALVDILPNAEIRVGIEHIAIGGIIYESTHELVEWQIESCKVWDNCADNYDVDEDWEYPDPDEYECIRVEFTDDGKAGIVESYD